MFHFILNLVFHLKPFLVGKHLRQFQKRDKMYSSNASTQVENIVQSNKLVMVSAVTKVVKQISLD